MSPVAKSLNILQGEVNIQMGWLLPTITTLTTKLEKSRPSLRFCKPLVDDLLEGLRKQFESMISEPEQQPFLFQGSKYPGPAMTQSYNLALGGRKDQGTSARTQ